MALSNIEKHYNKHPEDLRLQRRHGIVEFETTMHHLHRFLKPGQTVLDVGAGTGRYTSALMAEGYRVKAVELVRRNIEVFLKREPTADVVQGDARTMPFLPSATADVTLLLGPLYHLMGDDEKLKALVEAKRVTKPGGVILVAYLMNEYSILSYCFDEERIEDFLARGVVDKDYHIRVQKDELYDYVRLEDIDRLNAKAGLKRVTIFSPDGAADYMRTRLNQMSEATFARFIEYQKCISERPDLIGAGSHVVDVVRVEDDELQIRPSTAEDLTRMQEIFARARQFMQETGNPHQWAPTYPSDEQLMRDIESGDSYVCESGGRTVGTFVLRGGQDPTYDVIYDGAWPNDNPYGTIHRIASSGEAKGILRRVLAFARQRYATLRIDTHRDNRVMQEALRKEGFDYCGIIHCWNGDERLAYQW